MKTVFIRKCRMFMTFAAPDFDLLCHIYKTKGKQFDCLYPSSVNKEQLKKLVDNSEKKYHNTVNILVGNSATKTNNHIEVLNWLSRFKKNNIKIYCPLSYGDKGYASEVAEYGRKMFGDKFVPVLNYMKSDEYSVFLNKMDIAVFNNNRQQATANIEILGF